MISCSESMTSRVGNRTVVNTFGNCLKDFNVQRSSATVVSVIFVLLVTDDAICSFSGRKPDGGSLRYPRDDLTGIKREN